MNRAQFRRYCLGLPGATVSFQWDNYFVFKVAGKMFALLAVVDRKVVGVSFRVTSESFHILTREKGIRPAPYLARAGWVSLDALDTLPDDQLRAYVARSHALVVAKLSKKLQASLGQKQLRARTAP